MVIRVDAITGLISAAEYAAVLTDLKAAMTQLEPDGRNCAICGDTDHQAWECHHNPLVKAREGEGWKCYHCGEHFTDGEEARKHFGNIPSATPRCILLKCKCMDCDCMPSECAGRERWSDGNTLDPCWDRIMSGEGDGI